MKRKGPIWPWLVLAALVLVLATSCIGQPQDRNGDGRIDAREMAEPVAAAGLGVIKTALPQAGGIADWMYAAIFGGPPAAAAVSTYVSKRGSKKRHEAQEVRHRAEMKAQREENQKLREMIIEIAKRAGVPSEKLA